MAFMGIIVGVIILFLIVLAVLFTLFHWTCMSLILGAVLRKESRRTSNVLLVVGAVLGFCVVVVTFAVFKVMFK